MWRDVILSCLFLLTFAYLFIRNIISKMSPLRLITFDVTNTMIRVAGSVGKQYAHIARSLNRTVDTEAINKSFRHVYKEHAMKYPNFGVNSGMTSYQWWTEVVFQTFKDSGSDVTDIELLQLSQRLFQYYCTKHPWEVLPYAETTLQTLKSKDVKLAVISNFDDRLETVLANVGLKTYFDVILTSHTEKIEKPDPEIFQRALLASGVSAEESMHVGDNYQTDYLGARGVGMQACIVCDDDRGSALPAVVDRNYVMSDVSGILKFV